MARRGFAVPASQDRPSGSEGSRVYTHTHTPTHTHTHTPPHTYTHTHTHTHPIRNQDQPAEPSQLKGSIFQLAFLSLSLSSFIPSLPSFQSWASSFLFLSAPSSPPSAKIFVVVVAVCDRIWIRPVCFFFLPDFFSFLMIRLLLTRKTGPLFLRRAFRWPTTDA